MGMLGAWLRRVYRRGRGRRRGERPGSRVGRFPIGAAVLIRDARGRILLVQQTYRSSAIWLPPGGWVDRGETPGQAACREAREEVGGGGYGEVTILFECQVIGEPTLRLSDEIERAAFFPPDALPPLADQTRRWLAEALATLGADRSLPDDEAAPDTRGAGYQS